MKHTTKHMQSCISKSCWIQHDMLTYILLGQLCQDKFYQYYTAYEFFYVHCTFMRQYTSETMNPGLILITENNFPTPLLSFIFPALIKSKNAKILLLLANTYQNPKTPYQYCFYFACLVVDFFLLFTSYFSFTNTKPCA